MEARQNEAYWEEGRKRWRITVQRNGNRKDFYSAKRGSKGKIEAELKADKWIGCRCRADNVRFDELAEWYLDSIDTGHSTGNYRRELSVIRTWLLPKWEHRRVDSLTNRDYQDAVNAAVKCEPPRSARTCGHIRSTIAALQCYAESARIDMDRPIKIKIPRGATTKEKRVLTVEELRTLLTEGNQYWYVHAFRFIAVLGLRRGELCGLQVSDLRGNLLCVRRSINAANELTSGKTAAARRDIILPEVAMRILDDQRHMLKTAGITSSWLFPNIKGEQITPNCLYNRWLELRKALDLPEISIHELRHTMISTVKNDMPLPLIQTVVGHTPSMNTFGVYAHDTDRDKQRAAGAIDAIFADIF